MQPLTIPKSSQVPPEDFGSFHFEHTFRIIATTIVSFIRNSPSRCRRSGFSLRTVRRGGPAGEMDWVDEILGRRRGRDRRTTTAQKLIFLSRGPPIVPIECIFPFVAHGICVKILGARPQSRSHPAGVALPGRDGCGLDNGIK